ncbi:MULTISPECIES: acyl-CoA dehydrogenase family protein [Acidiphilium]|uniref:Putative acyl-CoA dehydrogenase n=1 Tax=Acidiphilium rubrum TaxID=526 RepID=A0A8G2FFH9_ACIRU|nr:MULTISPECIES: acyl-CoA dehydrogenase family protein [Acidiphilium]SIQ28505.1 putative acyl-CoA dehydrogenase [Acidiphilium rubrum]
MIATHDSINQVGEPPDYNVYTADVALGGAVAAFGGAWAEDRLGACGARVGSARLRGLARDANRYGPELRAFDRFGQRIDEIAYHPAWHELMGLIRGDAYHALAWTAARPGAQVARAGIAYVWGQGEPGVCCPEAMTYASMAALRHAPELLARFSTGILATAYDPRALPPDAKVALTVGMAMTEKQGGSDLRQTRTVARQDGGRWALTGHKWFFSVPMSDLFLTLARTDAGVSCFLAQGWRDDGSRNAVRIQRLKDKCGNRSNASSEVEFDGLDAVMVGEPGRGIATIIEMAHLTRLECAIGAAALMRHATSLAVFHASRRTAFQRALIDQPVMRAVLADMALDAETALWLAMRAAAAIDAAPGDPAEAALARVIVPVAKYWNCKRAPGLVAEAQECHGGNGFIEEHPIARLYREAPLNGVWEGAGNIICLDVLRALARTPGAADALLALLAPARGVDAALDGLIAGVGAVLAASDAPEAAARRLVEHIALAIAAALLVRHAPVYVAEAFIRARIADPGLAYGALPADLDQAALVRRAAIIPTD